MAGFFSPAFLFLRFVAVGILLLPIETLRIRSSFNLPSNELEQFEVFDNYIRKKQRDVDIIIFSNASSCNTDHGLACECLSKEIENLKLKKDSDFKQIWQASKNDTSPDCTYAIEPPGMVSSFDPAKGLFVFWKLKQECKNARDIPGGGASFEAKAFNDVFLVSCGIQDLFDNTYIFRCFLPSSFTFLEITNRKTHVSTNASMDISNNIGISTSQRVIKHVNLCLNITVTLMNEHFDAFAHSGNIGGLHNMLRHNLMKDVTYCSNESSTGGDGHDQNPFSYVDNFFEFNKSEQETLRGIWSRQKIGERFSWTGYYGQFLSNETFSNCRDHFRLIVAGESHQRYAWNLLSYHYLDAQNLYILEELGRKHGDISFKNFELHLIYLMPKVSKWLDSLQCGLNLGVQKIVIAIQTGTWDLASTLLQKVLRSPLFAPGLIESIKNMIDRGCFLATGKQQNLNSSTATNSNGTVTTYKLVFVQTMPYPDCPDNTCADIISQRKNGAIGAISQYFERNLHPLGSAADLEIVDTMSIIRPSKSSYECMNHFLCRHGGRQKFRVGQTNAGIALTQEMISSMCL